MTRDIYVQAKADHIASLARATPLSAVEELVWNALDADAREVRVDLVQNALGGIDANFNVPDAAGGTRLEIYGDEGYIIADGTLSQLEVGRLTHLHAPQGGYSAMQDSAAAAPTEYLGGGKDLYEKQIKIFCDLVRSGKPDYFFADRAVHIQELVEAIYKDAEK